MLPTFPNEDDEDTPTKPLPTWTDGEIAAAQATLARHQHAIGEDPDTAIERQRKRIALEVMQHRSQPLYTPPPRKATWRERFQRWLLRVS